MHILVINPNTTVSMTQKIGSAAKAIASEKTKIIAANSRNGPPSIQGYLDVAECLQGLLNEIKRHPDVDAVVIACFDDTGVDAVRCLVDVPVVGIGEAAYHAASMIASKFSVITTLPRSVPGLEANLARYALAGRCASVRATNIPVLDLEKGGIAMIDKIRHAIQSAITDDGAEAIILGCAGMTDLVANLNKEFKLPIIDGIACAVLFAEALVNAGLKTSKIGAYSV